jgi:hypothetical protein
MQILIADETLCNEFGFSSKNRPTRSAGILSRYATNMAHAQEIVIYDFTQISRLV